MPKQTTSDYLKIVFQYAVQSDADDWKRLSKKKNEDGQWVREFENRATGDRLKVTELEEGYYNVRGKDLEANIRIPEAFLAAAKKVAAAPSEGTVIVTDPAMNAAADKALSIIMGEDPDADIDDEDSDFGVPRDLLKQAGRALANRYCFAITAQDGVMGAMITPIRHFEETGYCSDQTGPIWHLLPKCSELMESTWEINAASVKTPVDAAKYLQSLGFHWHRGFQDFIDASQTKKLAAALEPKDLAAAVKKAHDADPGFEKAIADLVDAEAKYGKDDPAEGKMFSLDPKKGKGPKV